MAFSPSSNFDEKTFYETDNFKGYVGLSRPMYYSREFGRRPHGTAGPRFTNIVLERVGDLKLRFSKR